MRSLIALSLVMLLLSGCAVGPNYKRPSVDVPATYRGAAPQEAQQPASESLGDQKWWEVFQDQQLQALIHTALQQNYDVRIAATRILEARAQVGITRADGLPTINAGAQSFDQRTARQKFGVAKAAYFPQVSLTATSGFQSSALTSLFTGPAGLWNFGGSLVQPIFAGGRIRSGVRLSEARQQETLLTYQQTIQQAFRGVSDALVEYRKDREFRKQQEQLASYAEDAAGLSEMRYRGGATSYLEVLTNETNYFDAELGLAQAQLNELLGLVSIYRNLGGGWQEQ